jgi:phosphatidylserine synthase
MLPAGTLCITARFDCIITWREKAFFIGFDIVFAVVFGVVFALMFAEELTGVLPVVLTGVLGGVCGKATKAAPERDSLPRKTTPLQALPV